MRIIYLFLILCTLSGCAGIPAIAVQAISAADIAVRTVLVHPDKNTKHKSKYVIRISHPYVTLQNTQHQQ